MLLRCRASFRDAFALRSFVMRFACATAAVSLQLDSTLRYMVLYVFRHPRISSKLEFNAILIENCNHLVEKISMTLSHRFICEVQRSDGSVCEVDSSGRPDGIISWLVAIFSPAWSAQYYFYSPNGSLSKTNGAELLCKLDLFS